MIKYVLIYLIIGVVIAWLSMEAGDSKAKENNLTYREAHDQMMAEINQEIGAADQGIDSSSPPAAVLIAIVFLWFFIIPWAIWRVLKNR